VLQELLAVICSCCVQLHLRQPSNLAAKAALVAGVFVVVVLVSLAALVSPLCRSLAAV